MFLPRRVVESLTKWLFDSLTRFTTFAATFHIVPSRDDATNNFTQFTQLYMVRPDTIECLAECVK